LPKRGFINPNKIEYQVVNLGQLNEAFKDGEAVNRESLMERGLIGNARRPIKLLGKGELERSKLAVSVDRASASAAKALSDKGGSCEALVGKKAPANSPRRASATAAEEGASA
jgi:large subunit ribosomal protein L15